MNWYLQLPIKVKLMLSFTVIMVLTLAIALFAVQSMRNSQEVATYVNWTLEERYQRIAKMSTALIEVQRQSDLFIGAVNQAQSNGTPLSVSVASELQKSIRELDDASTALQLGRFPEQISFLKESSAQISKIFNNSVMPLLNAGQYEEALNKFSTEVARYYAPSYSALDEVRSAQIGEVIEQSVLLTNTKSMYGVIILTLLALVISLVIASLSSRYIKNALSIAIENISLMEHYDFSRKAESVYQDEFGALTRSLEELRLNLRNVTGTISSITENVSAAMQRAQSSTLRLSQNAAGSENRALTVAAATDEMVATTQNIAQNCDTAANLARQTSDKTNEGKDKAQDSINMIHQQVTNTQENSQQIVAMINQSRSIASIVDTINEISAQTNLLALNAAIEAARAGDAGRGFAVVADEVRALANRTGASTNEIAQKINLIEADANSATDSMDKAMQGISALEEDTAGLEHVLNEIFEHVEMVATQITQIATAAEEQTTATHEISTNMQDLTNSSREVAQIATETQNEIELTSSEIEKLVSTVSRFKL